jgi:kynurenine formamidase
MRTIHFCGLCLALTSATCTIADPVPEAQRWWPSAWGAEDERGAANRMTSAKVLEAGALITTGKVYSLGRVYEEGMPLFGKRHYSLTMVGSPSGGPAGTNRIVWNEEIISGEIGQIGTQLDGLGHVGVRTDGRDLLYNGFDRAEISKPHGLERLGIENAGPFFTRGVLLDIAAYKEVERLGAGYIITEQDIEKTLAKQGSRINPGDAVLIRTGHGQLWKKDNATYNASEPGIGMDAARWMVRQRVTIIGSDNWGVEAVPAGEKDKVFPVHELLLMRHGIYLLENLDLDLLAADKAYESAFIFAPLKLKGATGSPGNPIAVK